MQTIHWLFLSTSSVREFPTVRPLASGGRYCGEFSIPLCYCCCSSALERWGLSQRPLLHMQAMLLSLQTQACAASAAADFNGENGQLMEGVSSASIAVADTAAATLLLHPFHLHQTSPPQCLQMQQPPLLHRQAKIPGCFRTEPSLSASKYSALETGQGRKEGPQPKPALHIRAVQKCVINGQSQSDLIV